MASSRAVYSSQSVSSRSTGCATVTLGVGGGGGAERLQATSASTLSAVASAVGRMRAKLSEPSRGELSDSDNRGQILLAIFVRTSIAKSLGRAWHLRQHRSC